MTKSTQTSSPADDFERTSIEMTKEKAASISENLRRLADTVDRHAERIDRDSAGAVAGIVHDVMWGAANLNLDTLVTNESRIHQARESRLATELKNAAGN